MPGGFVPGAQQLSYLQVATLSYTCCTYSTHQATVVSRSRRCLFTAMKVHGVRHTSQRAACISKPAQDLLGEASVACKGCTCPTVCAGCSQGSAPAFNSAGSALLHHSGSAQPGAPFGAHLDPAAGPDFLIGQSDQARLMASVSNSPGEACTPHSGVRTGMLPGGMSGMSNCPSCQVHGAAVCLHAGPGLRAGFVYGPSIDTYLPLALLEGCICQCQDACACAGGNSELVTDALSRMLNSWTPLDLRMASDSISSNNSADTIRQMSMEQARNSSLLTSSSERPHLLRQLSAQVPMDVSGFWTNAANPPVHPMDPPRQ